MSNIIRSQRFFPLFTAQFFGAFNDNLFKNALVILITYKIASEDRDYSAQLVNIAFGLFTLPAFLFSYLAGQIADKTDRSHVVRWVKIGEIGLAILGGIALDLNSTPLLMITLFGFGTHAAFFGPVKYALLPQHLKEEELIAGNGYVEAGSFLAILTGTIVGGVMILQPGGAWILGALMILLALTGYGASRWIPAAPAPLPTMKLALNPVTETITMVRHSCTRRIERLCILGISWFWFIGSMFVAQLSPYVRDVLQAGNDVVTLFLVIFSVGIAVGSLLCARLIKGLVRPGPVPLGALGISLFAFDLFLASRNISPATSGYLINITEFLQSAPGWRITFDLFALALSAGIFIVPLYALLQIHADPQHGARAIASNNIVNAVFMVAASGIALGLIRAGLSIPQIFLATSLMNLFVAAYICKLLPFSLPAAILKLLYRVEVRGLENWAKAGERVLIVANHTAYLDPAIFASFLPGRVAFAVNTHTAQKWWIRPFLKLADTYPIDPGNPMATKTLVDLLKQNRKVMIFPEGRLTMTGSLMKIYEGPGMIADKSGAMILPVRIDGAQYSPFSKLKGKIRIRLFPKITLTLLPPCQFTLPKDCQGRRRRQLAGAQLYDLMSNMIFESSDLNKTLIKSLVDARHIHGGEHIVLEDQKRQPLNYDSLFTRIFALSRTIKRLTADSASPIGLMLPNMTETVVSFFALQAHGRIPAMLNYTAGPAQILSACRASDLKTIITSERFVQAAKLTPVIQALQEAGLTILMVEQMRAQITLGDKIFGFLAAKIPTLALSMTCYAQPDAAAVMLFTSGSEGTPKGVLLSHKNILANRYQLASRIDFSAQDIVFNALPIFHAFGLTGGTLLPLLSGVKIFLYPSPLHYRVVPELIYDCDATILFGTDTFLAGYGRFANPYDFYALRYVFAGAERLKEETRRLWMEQYGIRIFEGYGATETAPVISVNTAMHYRAGTVGRIMPGIKTKLETVSGITQGKKLHIKGPNVMMGYVKEDNPGALQPLSDGWYDTGDIVDIDGEGFVTIMGRTKRFAKIAGEMISLTAVETVIGALWPNINHAVVSVPDLRKGEALVLLTEYEEAQTDRLTEIFRHNGLSELSVPRRIIKLEAMPLLGTGKTDYITAKELALAHINANQIIGEQDDDEA